MRLDALKYARQQRLFEAAIIQPPDRRYRDGNQQNHRDG
jgi:hypothetical protein